MKKLVLLASFFSFLIVNSCLLKTIAQSPKSILISEEIKDFSKQPANQNEWIDVNAILLGVISSLIASGLFWYLLYRQKPVIKISTNIAQLTDSSRNPMIYNGKPLYVIKIINKTRAEIINVKFELSVAEVIGQTTVIDQSGQSKLIPRIKLENIPFGRTQSISELMIIDKFNKNDSEAKYSQQLVISEDLEQKCSQQNSFLLFKIVATHATSGFSKVYEKRYDYPLKDLSSPERSIIRLGWFQGGDSMEIR